MEAVAPLLQELAARRARQREPPQPPPPQQQQQQEHGGAGRAGRADASASGTAARLAGASDEAQAWPPRAPPPNVVPALAVTLTWAQSLDGSLTSARGRATSISCPESLELTHALRAAHGGIVVGVGTVLCDNPSLTTRLVAGADPQPVVLDSQLRTPLGCKLLTDARCRRKPILVCLEGAATAHPERAAALRQAGARLLEAPPDASGRVDLARALALLAGELDSVMIEGGASVISSALGSAHVCALISRVVLTVAPLFLGGVNAVQGGSVPAELQRAWRLERAAALGGDLIVSLVRRTTPELSS
jgi:riboflavin-specific deaminase-like protein